MNTRTKTQLNASICLSCFPFPRQRILLNSTDVSTNIHTTGDRQNTAFHRFSTTYLHNQVHLPVCANSMNLQTVKKHKQRGRLISQTRWKFKLAVQFKIRSESNFISVLWLFDTNTDERQLNNLMCCHFSSPTCKYMQMMFQNVIRSSAL